VSSAGSLSLEEADLQTRVLAGIEPLLTDDDQHHVGMESENQRLAEENAMLKQKFMEVSTAIHAAGQKCVESENARLVSENAVLRKQCMEASHAAAAAGAAAAAQAAAAAAIATRREMPAGLGQPVGGAGFPPMPVGFSPSVQPIPHANVPPVCWQFPAQMLLYPGSTQNPGVISSVNPHMPSISLAAPRNAPDPEKNKAGGPRNRPVPKCHTGNMNQQVKGPLTTLMLRNIPNNYTREMMLQLLDDMGFQRKYDFFYLPFDFTSHAGLGYAFVNMANVADAQAMMNTMEGFSDWAMPSHKVCSVRWSAPYQGLEAHIDRYRNSPVMHEVVPEEHKPLVFRDGQRIPFPPPTRHLPFPSVRKRPQ